MSAQSLHSNLHFVLEEQDESGRHLDQQQIPLNRSTQVFFLISLAGHYAAVEAKLTPTGARENPTRQSPSVGMRFARCCKTSTILTTAIVTEKVQRTLDTYFSACHLDISCVEKYVSPCGVPWLRSDFYLQCKRLGLPLWVLVLESSERKT